MCRGQRARDSGEGGRRTCGRKASGLEQSQGGVVGAAGVGWGGMGGQAKQA